MSVEKILRVERRPLKEWEYLKLKIWCEEEDANPPMTELTFRMTIQQALQATFGLAGAAIVIDVLDWNEAERVGYIKVPQRDLVTVRNAFMFHRIFVGGYSCTIDVLGSSASLISLADDSRVMV